MENLFLLYYPLGIAALGLYGAVRWRFTNKKVFSFSKYGFNFVFTRNICAKFVLVFISLSFLPLYLFMDFSRLFPSDLKMNVFYDTDGIMENLGNFSDVELAKIKYRAGNEKFAMIYYRDIDATKARVSGQGEFFTIGGGEIHSAGRTDFIVEKVRGIHRYHIVGANGYLTHMFERAGGGTEQFTTFFQKTPSQYDFAQPSFKEIIVNRSIIIYPHFKQTFAKYGDASGEEIAHWLIGVTKVTLWPIPSYSNTVYFYLHPQKGAIPIGYAVYY